MIRTFIFLTWGICILLLISFMPANAQSSVCPSDAMLENDAGECSASYTYALQLPTNYSAEQLQGLVSGSNFPVGTTTNIFKLTDGAGTESQCSFTITIKDVENPMAQCAVGILAPVEDGSFTVPVSGIDAGSTDNCAIISVGVVPGSFPMSLMGTEQMVTLNVADAAGNTATCTTMVSLLGDSNPYEEDDDDCDGVPNDLDLCPSGDDSIDSNGDGQPDCAGDIDLDQLIDDWYCGNNANNQKVLICHIPPGNPANAHTICVSKNAVSAHLAHGDFLGACDAVICAGNDPEENEEEEEEDDDLDQDILEAPAFYPNPAHEDIFIQFNGWEGQTVSLRLLNRHRQLVHEEVFAEAPPEDYHFSLAGLHNGVYYLSLEAADGRRWMRRVVVVR